MFRFVFAIILLLAVPTTAFAEPGDEAIDIYLRSHNLGDLAPAQQISARNLVRRMIAVNPASSTLRRSADSHFRSKGYEPVHLKTVAVQGRYFLIADTGILTYATSDLPSLFSPSLFSEGEYYSKARIGGGVSEFIDERGDEQSLLFAKWIPLRR